ncbi:MAG: anthranilate synthase component 1 [Candidatus Paceibacteria bacterium]|jgi:anthranilate synthase component 1
MHPADPTTAKEYRAFEVHFGGPSCFALVSRHPHSRLAVTRPLDQSAAADADQHHLAWARYPADLRTPVSAFLAMRAAGRQVCLLESVETGARLTRFSFLGVDPVAHFRGRKESSELKTKDGTETLSGPAHEGLREASMRYKVPVPPVGLPPFIGGWVGYFTYEWVTSLEPRVPRAEKDPWDLPDATFDLYREVIAFDHATQLLHIISGCPAGASEFEAASARIEAIATDLFSGQFESGPFQMDGDGLQPQSTQQAYESGVGDLKQAISQGEIFQAVLSQRFSGEFEGDPFTLYRGLRLTNPSPHMFFFEADGLTLVGSSPERLVQVTGGHAHTVPIAGTRPRGATPEKDDALGAALLADTKERAEHDMLVDLARNDLGRVGRIGTVGVKEYASLEQFSRVQHLVSRVECELSVDADALDALVACFPAGTVSGAPKIRAMELLAEKEGQTRGPYAGCFGYLDGSGNLDMAITIRTLVVRDGQVHLQAGAGIVHESNPAAEYAETLHKAGALFDSIQLTNSPAFGSPQRSTSPPAPEVKS